MVKNLHTIIKDSMKKDRNHLAALLWINGKPAWVTNTMFVWNDPNLLKYYGNYQLNHFREHLRLQPGHGTDSTIGLYGLEVQRTHIHITSPQKPTEVPGYNGNHIGENIEMLIQRDSSHFIPLQNNPARAVATDGIPLYQYMPQGNIPGWYRESNALTEFYLRRGQVDYLKEIAPGIETTAAVVKEGTVCFRQPDLFAGITLIVPGWVKKPATTI